MVLVVPIQKNIEIASYIKNELNVEALAHLTGAPSSFLDVDNVRMKLKKNNIENILVLRGIILKIMMFLIVKILITQLI